jgi:hypothetical protein
VHALQQLEPVARTATAAEKIAATIAVIEHVAITPAARGARTALLQTQVIVSDAELREYSGPLRAELGV